MDIVWIILGSIALIAGTLLVRFEWGIIKARVRDLERKERLALELHPAYRAKVAEDRAYQLSIARFRLECYLAMHRSPAETYIVNEEVQSIIALPSLKRSIDQAQLPAEVPPLPLPGPCDLTDILETWRPSQQEIFLALGPGGQRITVPLKALCHVALAGTTGGGKSSLMRLLLPQIEYVGARVALADPHFTLFDAESDEDWRPIASRLAIEPAVSYAAIKDILAWMAKSELPGRLERRRNGQVVGEAFFLALDELPAIVANVPEAPALMATLLREGRKVGLFLISSAQDWLVKTVGGSGGVRDCFRTAFYVGGDAHTARVLLDVKGAVDDGGLGKGIVMLRSMATPKASLTRIPYASNEAISGLLSTSESTTGPLRVPLQEMVETASSEPLRVLDSRTMRIREMVKDKIPPSKIIEELWGETGGSSYQKAARELTEIMSKLV